MWLSELVIGSSVPPGWTGEGHHSFLWLVTRKLTICGLWSVSGDSVEGSEPGLYKSPFLEVMLSLQPEA